MTKDQLEQQLEVYRGKDNKPAITRRKIKRWTTEGLINVTCDWYKGSRGKRCEYAEDTVDRAKRIQAALDANRSLDYAAMEIYLHEGLKSPAQIRVIVGYVLRQFKHNVVYWNRRVIPEQPDPATERRRIKQNMERSAGNMITEALIRFMLGDVYALAGVDNPKTLQSQSALLPITRIIASAQNASDETILTAATQAQIVATQRASIINQHAYSMGITPQEAAAVILAVLGHQTPDPPPLERVLLPFFTAQIIAHDPTSPLPKRWKESNEWYFRQYRALLPEVHQLAPHLRQELATTVNHEGNR